MKGHFKGLSECSWLICGSTIKIRWIDDRSHDHQMLSATDGYHASHGVKMKQDGRGGEGGLDKHQG